MKRILLVKITSMGDLIQMLPALTDATDCIPGFSIDWLVDESFVEIAQLHSSVGTIFPLPYRRWKKNIRQSLMSGEVPRFLKRVRSQSYDMVIDAQSNLKSAFVSLFTKGKRYGLDSTSVREYGAHFAYHEQITVSREQNHAQRMRQLMATYLDYELPTTPADYGINKDKLPNVDFALPENFIFITAICSNSDRLWPEAFWHEVIKDIIAKGYDVVLPWWSEVEKQRATRLKNQSVRVHLIPPLNLMEKASILAKATAAISVDTGLAHMAAALNIPNVTLYGPTSAQLTGAYGQNQVHLSASGPSCAPCLRTKCTYTGASQYKPACLETISPQQVLSSFYAMLDRGR
jgi:heptosyltransferase-1